MTLIPESYFLEANKDKKIVDLICELPNTGNEHRKKELLIKPIDQHENYYNAHLLLETKRFSREMLHLCALDVSAYESILRSSNLMEIFTIIKKFRVTFFRYLVLRDLESYRLFRGNMEIEIKAANTIDEMQKHIKKYGVLSKLIRKMEEDYKRLKSIYC